MPSGGGYGDLRAISKKKWSRSFDDLTRMISKPESVEPVSPIRMRTVTAPYESSDNVLASQRVKIEAYRAGAQVSFPSLSPLTASPPNTSYLNTGTPLPPSSSLRRDEPSPNRPRSRSFQAPAPPALQIAQRQQPPPVPTSPTSPSFRVGPKPSFPPVTHAVSPKERKVHHAGSFGFSLASFGKGSPTNDTAPGIPAVGGNSPDTPVDQRRMSQVIHIAGFLSRHPSITSAGAPPLNQYALMKGWKPFKVVVRGSKLLCYKPPSDRAAAIRELFPQGTVSAIIEAQDEDEGEEEEEIRVSPVAARAQRAYWGKGPHPKLVLGADGGVHRGTAEALAHECIYATTAADGPETEARWRTFASAVLLCLPLIVGREKFEGEFRRYAERMLADDKDGDDHSRLRARVAWLVRTYLLHHFLPSDEHAHANEVQAWCNWCAGKDVAVLDEAHPTLTSYLDEEPVPLPSQPIHDGGVNGTIFVNPFLNVKNEVNSPHVNVFSPRPSDVEKIPSVTATFVQHGSPTSSRPINQQLPSRMIAIKPGVLNALAVEGLTKEVFLELPEPAITSSLSVYFRGALSSVLGGSGEAWVGDSSRLRSAEVIGVGPVQRLRDFSGSDNTPHWLTLHILEQILAPFGASGVGSHGSAGRGAPSQDGGRAAHSRASLLSRWVRVGEQARAAGDVCTWRAICAALCSRPVARLERLWRRCDPEVRRVVARWSAVLSERDERVASGETGGAPEAPPRLPWVGDLPEQARNILESAKTGGAAKGNEWEVEMLLNVERLTDKIGYCFSQCEVDVLSPVDDNRLSDEDMARLVQYWEHLAAKPLPGLSGVGDWMRLSLTQEPTQRGQFAAHFWSSVGPQPAQSLLPLLFVEPLPYISFMDRAQLNRTKKDSLEGGAARPEFFERQIAQTTRPSRSSDPASSNTSLGSLTVLPIFDGELTLLVQPGEVEQPNGLERKMSVNHSIRVSPAGQLERKSSTARRSSMPILSNNHNQERASMRSAESSDPPLRAIVKAGTLDRLIDLLVFGLQGVTVGHSDDNGEMPLREGGSRPLHVDRAEFSRVWWFNFRAFVSPIAFFELLRKRYLSATMPSQRTEVLQTVEDWLKKGGGAQDALDNMDLWDGMNAFLTAPAHRAGRASQVIERVPVDADAAEELEETRRLCLGTFIKLTMRPRASGRTQSPSKSRAADGLTFGSHVPSVDDISPEAFVDNLDSMAATMFKTAYAEDFFLAADIFEIQACDRTGWYNSGEAPTSSEVVDIEDIYKHLSSLGASPIGSNTNANMVHLESLLPNGIRSVLTTHSTLTRWAIGQIASPHLGLQKREQRMEYFLRAIEVCRIRSRPDINNMASLHQPSVRSFVETVLTSAILSVQSRVYHKAWQNVAAQRNVGVDSLLSLTARSDVPPLIRPRQKLTPDLGWVFERMLEILSMADTVPPSSFTGSAMINYDKRRSLTDLVLTALGSVPQRSSTRSDQDQVDVDRLNRMHSEAKANLDSRSIRDAAYREATQQTTNRKSTRPFQTLVSAQQEKLKRDRHIRERLSKEKRIEQIRSHQRDEDLNRAMQARRGSGTGSTPKHQRGKKSMSTLYKIMRPISTAFSSDSLFDGGRGSRRTPAELDFEAGGTPALVLSLVDARVSAFVNNQRSFTFFLDTEDGGRFLFQAMSKVDMNKWMSAINSTAQSSVLKRRTYIANSPKPQLADHLQVAAANPRDPVKVFGVELQFLLEREVGSAEIPPGTIPNVLSILLTEIEARGLEEEGLYRIAGQKSVNERIKDIFNSGQPVDLQSDAFLDIYSLCDVVKTWFRELPGGLFPEDAFLQVMQAMQHPDFESRIESARHLVHSLPRSNFDLLRRIIEHLGRITDFEDHNHMNPENLAIVFGPNLIRAPTHTLTFALSSMGQATALTRLFIMNFNSIFDEPEPEGDGDASQEVDDELEDVEEEDGDDGVEDTLEDVQEDAAETELDSTLLHGRSTPLSSPGSGDDHTPRHQHTYFPDLSAVDLHRMASLSSESILPPPTQGSS